MEKLLCNILHKLRSALLLSVACVVECAVGKLQ